MQVNQDIFEEPMMNTKVFGSFKEAVADISDGASIMMGLNVAGPAGVPQNLILALRDHGAKELTVIASNYGWLTQTGIAKQFVTPSYLLETGQVKKAIVNWTRSNRPGEETPLQQAVNAGLVEFELLPMGVQATRIKVGGMGIGAYYSPIGVGTVYEKGKEKRVINGKEYLLEYPLRADYGFIRAEKADSLGNLVYRGTARSFNPLVAKACDITIVEVDEIVEPGAIDPESVITSGIYVDRIVKVPKEC